MKKLIAVTVIDDHRLFLKGFRSQLKFSGYKVVGLYENGKDFIDDIDQNDLPEVIFISANMPLMDRYIATLWVKENYPAIKILAMVIDEDKPAIKAMIKMGASGFVFKDIEPRQIKTAIDSIIRFGAYNPTKFNLGYS